jgi:hypothetical protein
MLREFVADESVKLLSGERILGTLLAAAVFAIWAGMSA